MIDKLFSKDKKRTTSEITFLCKVYLDINVESVRYEVMGDLCHMIFLLYKYPDLISIEGVRALSCLREREKYSEIIDQIIDFLNYAVLQNSNFLNNHEEVTDILVNISNRNMGAVYLRDFFQAKRLIDNNEYPLEAWEYLETAEKQFDYYAPIYYYQGLYQVNKGELSSAIKLFEMALSLRPVYVEAAQRLSAAHYKIGDWASARIVNQTISELYPVYRTLTRSQISGIVASSVPLAQIPMLTAFDKAYQVVALTADTDLNVCIIDQIMTLLNTPALSANKLAFCRESYQLDEGLAVIRHSQEKRRFLNDFLSYVLDKFVWFEYHQHYAVNRERRAMHDDLDKLIDASKITDIFEIESVQCLKQQLQQYCQLFNMDNFLQHYAGTAQLRGGYALGISKDLAQTYSVFHNILGLYHYEAAYGISNAQGEDDLFNFVLHQQKPVVFFIPTAIGAGKKDGFTYREINWIAQKLKTNPTELKNLILVFDSYNYLPLYSLITLVDSKWIINVDHSINAVLDFLLEYVIAPTDAAERMPILRSNIENHVHINIYGYMLYVLNSAIEYDPEFDNTSFVDILKLLIKQTFKINIEENINPQIRLPEFYSRVEAQLNLLKENPNKQNKQKLGVILRFLTELFANNFYANYINPENRYIDIESRLYVLTEQYNTLSPDFDSWKKSRDKRWAILQAASKNAYPSSLDIIFTKLKDFNKQGFFDINEESLADYLIPDDVQRSKRALKRINDYQYAKKNRKLHDTYGELGNNWTHHETLADGNCALSAFALGLLYHRNNGNDLLTTKRSFRRKFAQSFYLNPDTFTEEVFSQVMDALLSPQIDLDNPIIKKIIKKLSNVENVVEGTESNQINTKIEAANQRIFKPEIFENGNIRPEYRDGAIKCLARQGILYQLAMAYALREYCFSYNEGHFRCFIDRMLEEPQERDLTLNIANQFGEYLTEDIFAFLAYKFKLKIQLKTQEFGKIYNYGNSHLDIMIFALKPGEGDCHFELVLPSKRNFLEGKLAMLRVINYPALLSQFGINTKVRMNKATGPRVEGAIEEIRKKMGDEKALEIEAKFCHWAKEHNRNFNFKR
ncbi:MAG: hypothetical protein K2Q14_00170 [Gammaproteobacteria bacterium]|nr:hypothetical protein [Gammaproteobacteria bacterium]